MPGPRFDRSSVPDRLLVVSAVGFAVVFALITAFEVPGRGMGHFFYLPIVLCALATGAAWGGAAGLLAFILFWSGLVLGGQASFHDAVSIRGGIRFASFIVVGAVVGFFASRARRMMGDSLHVLDELLVLAGRDLATGISNGRGFESAVNRRIGEKRPFVLLVGERPGAARLSGPKEDEELRKVAAMLSLEVDRGDELARVSPGHFALLLPCTHAGEARAAAARLERTLDENGYRMSFGQAMFPLEGGDLLSLFRSADERLYARMTVRGEWVPTAAGAGLVDDLDRLRDVSSA